MPRYRLREISEGVTLGAPLILLVDDDGSLVTLLGERLHREGYDVRSCGDGKEAREVLNDLAFDVILLDVMLPDQSGFELCAELRSREIETPILMLTARGNVTDRVTGLRMGADDYLSKPFEVPELLARIEALRRRSSRNAHSSPSLFEFGDVSVNFDKRSVSRAGQPIRLSRREFGMLSHLIRNQGRVVLRDEMLQTVWGYRAFLDTRTVDVHMWQLRKKLEWTRSIHGSSAPFGGQGTSLLGSNHSPDRSRNNARERVRPARRFELRT